MKDASEHVHVSNSNNAKDEDVLPKPMVRCRTRSAPSTYDPNERETKQKKRDTVPLTSRSPILFSVVWL